MKTIFRFTIVIVLLSVLIVLMLVLVGRNVSAKGTTVTFLNSSGQLISAASISVAGQSCAVKELGIDGEMECRFENLHESSYSISVTLQDGRKYSEPSMGYVTRGVNFTDTITINSSGKILHASKIDT